MTTFNGKLAIVYKIDLLVNLYFYLNMEPYTPFHHLESGREYYILRRNGKKYKGIFDNYKYSYLNDDEAEIFAVIKSKTLSYFYRGEDKFYDVKCITMNAYIARHNMELRALKKILKKVVNEDFQW